MTDTTSPAVGSRRFDSDGEALEHGADAAVNDATAAGAVTPDESASCSVGTRNMSSKQVTGKKSAGTTIESTPNYDYELTAHGTHRWTHVETGLTVEMSRVAGHPDGFGNVDHGYTALVRAADGSHVADIISHGSYLPTKREAYDTVRAWLADHAEGRQ